MFVSIVRPLMTPVAHIVDDDPAVRDALQWLLRSRNVSSETWHSGESFLHDATSDLFGCCLLDVLMPGRSGIELFDRLRAMRSQIPELPVHSAWSSRWPRNSRPALDWKHCSTLSTRARRRSLEPSALVWFSSDPTELGRSASLVRLAPTERCRINSL